MACAVLMGRPWRRRCRGRAGKEVDDIAGAAGGELEVVRLDENEGAFTGFVGGVGDDVVEEPPSLSE